VLFAVAPQNVAGAFSRLIYIRSSSGHRVAHLEFGQDRLAQSHPLLAFELAQRSVDAAFNVCFIPEQAIESWAIRYIATHYFQLRSRGRLP